MQITDIKVWLAKTGGSNYLGNGSITFNNSFFVKFMICKSSKNGEPYINWPSKKGNDGKWYNDVGFVIDEESDSPYAEKNRVENAIIAAFNKQAGISNKTDTDNDTSFNYGANVTDSGGDIPFKTDDTTTPPSAKKKPLIKLKR